MKEYSKTLLLGTRNDLTVAEKILADSPNLAAFHSQQCAEKALKSLVFEFGDYKNEDEFGIEIGHDSIRAVTSTLRNILNLMHNKMDSEVKKKLNRKFLDEYMLLITPIREEMSNLLTIPPIEKVSGKYWDESLDPKLEPKLVISKNWSVKSDSHRQLLDAKWKDVMSRAGINIPEVVNLLDPRQNLLKKIKDLDLIINKLRSIGQHKLADGFVKFKSLIGPDLELAHLLELAIKWGPYLDAHAVRARYPGSEDLKKYQNSLPAVENLVKKSREILELTEKVMNILQEWFKD